MVNSNTTTYLVPQLLAQGLLALREQAVMPRFVNRAYESMAGEKGSTIDVPVSSAISASSVTAPSYQFPDDAGISPTRVQIQLNKWYEAAFFLSDKDMLECMSGSIPLQAQEAVKALANQVDDDLLALYKEVYGYAGVAGTTPFATDLSEYLDARKVLNEQLAPLDSRFVVLDADAEANALGLRAFQDASFRGDSAGINEGIIGRKLGATWFVDQRVPLHTAGTASGATLDNTDMVAGVKTGTLASAGTGTILVGDIITFAADTTGSTYTVTSGDADVSGGGSISWEPGLAMSWTTNATAITVKGNHRANMLFHRDAFALANRPFSGADPMGVGVFQSAVDPISGLTLRLEINREYKRTRFSYDILYGVKAVRPALAARLAG